MIFDVNTIMVSINEIKLSKRIPLACPINLFPLKDNRLIIIYIDNFDSRFYKANHLFLSYYVNNGSTKMHLFCTKK